jgi:riboflavin biosynthesis pyrimidine reductase
VSELIAELELGERATAERPYTVANMIESIDGRGSFDGRSTALGDAGDKQVFRALRSVCDVVLVGTGTLATEHYGRLVRDPDVAAARERLGLAAQPLLCTVSRSGNIPPGIPLLADPAASMIIYSGAAVDLGDVAATVEVVTVDPSRLSLASALHDLRIRRQVRLVLCEGGPTVLGQLIGDRAIDELFVTFAGKLAGGTGPAIVSGLTLPDPLVVSPLWLLEQDGSLFLRYGFG